MANESDPSELKEFIKAWMLDLIDTVKIGNVLNAYHSALILEKLSGHEFEDLSDSRKKEILKQIVTRQSWVEGELRESHYIKDRS